MQNAACGRRVWSDLNLGKCLAHRRYESDSYKSLCETYNYENLSEFERLLPWLIIFIPKLHASMCLVMLENLDHVWDGEELVCNEHLHQNS